MKIKLRKEFSPCKYCSIGIEGEIITKNGQDCVYCSNCSRFLYNAPKWETEREDRTLSSIRTISPSKRFRILNRANGKCEICGKNGELVVDHIIPVIEFEKEGFNIEELNLDENLCALCPECNSGKGKMIPSIRLYATMIKRRGNKDDSY